MDSSRRSKRRMSRSKSRRKRRERRRLRTRRKKKKKNGQCESGDDLLLPRCSDVSARKSTSASNKFHIDDV